MLIYARQSNLYSVCIFFIPLTAKHTMGSGRVGISNPLYGMHNKPSYFY